MGDGKNESGRFRAAMPHIPGVPDAAERRAALHRKLGLALGGAAVLSVLIAWWALRNPHAAAMDDPATQAAQPVASEPLAPARVPEPPRKTGPSEVATLAELARPWSAKRFDFRTSAGEDVAAMVVRLPGAGESYWAFALRVPYGRCELEYVTDTARLAREYDYRATHPMVLDPCSGVLYDPLRMGTLSSGAWARGEVVRGPGLRPPLAIEVIVRGTSIVATRIE